MDDPAQDGVLSPWGMFLHADPIVQVVMGALIFASVVTWTILIAKAIGMHKAAEQMRASIGKLDQALLLSSVERALPSSAASRLVAEAHGELTASTKLGATGHAGERIAVALERVIAGETRQVGFGVGTIATIGTTAPFVGLFGTVWGIMNSFIGIAKTHTTNLAVVAPGIAEALLATACGLVAAIPAVIIYNHLTRNVGGFRVLLADASALVTRLASRELDAQRLDGHPANGQSAIHAGQAAVAAGELAGNGAAR